MRERWERLKARYGETVEQYGRVAMVTYLVLFFGTWFAFWAAIKAGVQLDGAAAGAGTVGAAYLATKLTQPVRIGATIVFTPMIAALLGHRQTPSPS